MNTSPAEPSPPLVVGWREWVALPELGIGRIKAKIDTGARTSALHAIDLHETTREGTPWMEFTVFPRQRDPSGAVRTGAPLADEREVRSSSGEAHLRPVIVVAVTIGPMTYPAEFTLTRRDRMGFRILIGRTTLRSRFVVDPAASYLQSL